MRLRGFTLIETVLAASLGSILVLMVVGMLGFMDRAEKRQSERIEQVDGIARVHTVMDKVFSSLLVADMNIAAAAPVSDPGVDAPGKAKRETARLLIHTDESDSLKSMMSRMHISGSVQRMEVVLDKPLLPQNFAQGLSGSLATSAQATLSTDGLDVIPGPIRGVFELRPDRATVRATGDRTPPREDGKVGWTLWWRPLVYGDREADPKLLDPTEDPRAVPLIAGLESCNWKGFVEREHKDNLRVTTYLNLPAYMEMEVRTLGGYYANWLFEMQWSVGNEDKDDKKDKKDTKETGGRRRAEPADGRAK